VTITLRGTEVRHSKAPLIRSRMKRALLGAQRIFAVSESLRMHAFSIGIGPPRKIIVVGNGVDAEKFYPMDKAKCRESLSIPQDAKVLITVGALVERKGYHRVINLLPELRKRHPNLHYIAVGGASPEGDWTKRLKRQVAEAGLKDAVTFLGPLSQEGVRQALSAADLFVLATRNEGWANVILEAMACGLPVIATDVGGNNEVVANENIGVIVPYDSAPALKNALDQALARHWDRTGIRTYACANSWDGRVATLVAELQGVAAGADFSWPRTGLRQKTRNIATRLETEWVAIRKTAARSLRCPPTRRGRGMVAFVAGAQRSGTNMLMDVLDRSLATDVYHERDPRAFDNYQLRDPAIIQKLHDDSCAPLFIVKSLCELPRLPELMAYFRPAKAVWIVRDYRDTANSVTLSFPSQVGVVNRIAKYKDKTDGWRSEGISDETHAIFQRFAGENLDDKSAAALMWYSRNVLFYEKGLDNNPNVMLVKYEDLVTQPEVEAKRVFDFLGLVYSPWHTRHLFSTSIGRRAEPPLIKGVREICDGLLERYAATLATAR